MFDGKERGPPEGRDRRLRGKPIRKAMYPRKRNLLHLTLLFKSAVLVLKIIIQGERHGKTKQEKSRVKER